MSAALAGLIGQLGTAGMQLPLGYGQMYQGAYGLPFNYYGNQAGNMTALGQGGMGLYGNLAGQQASMYQAELPHMAEMAMFNALAPALGGILNSAGMGGINISPMQMGFNRPDVMGGYQDVMNRSYDEAQRYDGLVGGMTADMMDKMPTAPYMQQQQQAPQAPQAAYQSPLMQPQTLSPAQLARQQEQQNFQAPAVGSPQYMQRAQQQNAAGRQRHNQRLAGQGVAFQGGPNPNTQRAQQRAENLYGPGAPAYQGLR